jgi:spermidine synthase
MKANGSYESLHPSLFQPDRVVYLDKIMQSRRFGEAAYHEALVHPAMLSHDQPRRVLIIGGGEGATLREVLKHKSVESVTMVEIDRQMVQIARTFLPEWNFCGNFGTTASCFDDPRTEIVYEDAVNWLIDGFGKGRELGEADRYDVVIMDAL